MYVEFTVSQTMEHFLSCHEHAFAAFGGVPAKIMVDNLKSAVLQRLAGVAPVFNARYADFAQLGEPTAVVTMKPRWFVGTTTFALENTLLCRGPLRARAGEALVKRATGPDSVRRRRKFAVDVARLAPGARGERRRGGNLPRRHKTDALFGRSTLLAARDPACIRLSPNCPLPRPSTVRLEAPRPSRRGAQGRHCLAGGGGTRRRWIGAQRGSARAVGRRRRRPLGICQGTDYGAARPLTYSGHAASRRSGRY